MYIPSFKFKSYFSQCFSSWCSSLQGFSPKKQSHSSCFSPFKHLPSWWHLAHIFIFSVSFTQIWRAYFLPGQRGPKTNSPSLSVKVWPIGNLSSLPQSYTISTNFTTALRTGSLKQFLTTPYITSLLSSVQVKKYQKQIK